MVRHRQQVKAARFILVSGKCFDSKRGKKKEGGRREKVKSLHLKIHSIGKNNEREHCSFIQRVKRHDIELQKKAERLSHVARSSEPLPSPGRRSTLKYTFFLVSGPPGLIEKEGFSPETEWVIHGTQGTSTNKKALERTKTSQCRRLLWWSSAGHPGASSLVAACYGILNRGHKHEIRYNTVKHQENLSVLLGKQS